MKPPSRLRALSLAAIDLAMLRGALARLSYRLGLHGALAVVTHDIVVSSASALPRPLTIAFASDFHAGPTTHPDIFHHLADALIDCSPDVLVLGGDFVSCRARYLPRLLEPLARHRPWLGTYAILGNHDVWADADSITRQLDAAGITVLTNCSAKLAAPFEDVTLCGIDDPWVGEPDLPRAFAAAGKVRVFLLHSPDGLVLLRGQRFDLALAGHTHGGQVALPGGIPILTGGGPLSRRYSRGRFELSGNGPLIVSRGVGCSNLPIRWNSDPELTLCRLLNRPAEH
jgi:predicted MPP superfamily phosphohydrolase